MEGISVEDSTFSTFLLQLSLVYFPGFEGYLRELILEDHGGRLDHGS